MVEVVDIGDFACQRAEEYRHVIARVSFEERSVLLGEHLATHGLTDFLAFVSRERSPLAERNLGVLRAKLPHLKQVELEIGKPMATARTLAVTMHEAIRRDGLDQTLIDVTSFRREELLMLLAVLRNSDLRPDCRCMLAYVASESMGENLSEDVTELRSVIGYAGDIRPALKTRLVLMMGFETHRARSIIEGYEPDEVLIGVGRQADSINPELHRRNLEFSEEVKRMSANVVGNFEFSARDPLQVVRELSLAIGDTVDANIIIAPLNTKLSTLGAGLYALEHPEIQVCYAPVRRYIEANYSKSAQQLFLVPISELLQPDYHELAITATGVPPVPT
jgi:hypothetical protein